MVTIAKDIWITREGHSFQIKEMASSHLLAAIHYIERNRFMNAAETFSEMQMDDKTRMEATNYYLQWPIQYETLIAEAQRRNLIFRNVEGLVIRKKK